MAGTKPNLQSDITYALEGWIANGANVTAFDRLSAIKLGILEGRYEGNVTLDTLKSALETRKVEFAESDMADEAWRSRWVDRTESFVDSVESSINYLRGERTV